ncbi:hypothetical protein AMTR_s00136p00063120 [Amborella trichopoda]|uniref:Uncharacterized protein n=1 Tax=Amborella trichopoda TaxID=13333 RepID=W1NDZ9_AMBTC|nr:hypothetical protein AMTR_s00136p00063120 [Amborella trichopoda]
MAAVVGRWFSLYVVEVAAASFVGKLKFPENSQMDVVEFAAASFVGKLKFPQNSQMEIGLRGGARLLQ